MANRITRNNSKAHNKTASRLSLTNSTVASSPRPATAVSDVQLSLKQLEVTMLSQIMDMKSSIQSEIAALKAQIASLERKLNEIDPLITQLSELNSMPLTNGPNHRPAADPEVHRPILAGSVDNYTRIKQPAVVLSSVSDHTLTDVSVVPTLSACDIVKTKSLLLTNCAPSATCESVCHWINKNANFDEAIAANLKCVDLSARRRQSGNLTFASFKLIVPEEAVETLNQPTFWPPGTLIKEFVRHSPPLGFRRRHHRRPVRVNQN